MTNLQELYGKLLEEGYNSSSLDTVIRLLKEGRGSFIIKRWYPDVTNLLISYARAIIADEAQRPYTYECIANVNLVTPEALSKLTKSKLLPFYPDIKEYYGYNYRKADLVGCIMCHFNESLNAKNYDANIEYCESVIAILN